jgi:hypothetical protein
VSWISFPGTPADVKNVDRSMFILGGCDWLYIYMCVCVFLLSAGNVRLCKVDTTNIYTIYYDIYIYRVCVHRNMYA